MERVHKVEGCHLFFQKFLCCVLNRKKFKIIYIYTFFHEHSSFFYLRFSIFHSNQMDVISNIYNPQGSNLHTNCSVKAVNSNTKSKNVLFFILFFLACYNFLCYNNYRNSFHANIAQLVEQRIRNPQVSSSILLIGSIFN